MADACKHTVTRFVARRTTDEYPGMFECVDCGDKFTSDPNNPDSVRFLSQPNPRSTKTITLAKGGKY